MYSYAQRPTCTMQYDCGSLYLFCSRHNGVPHCVSKIRSNGQCVGYENEDACYQGICIDGFCRPGAFETVYKILFIYLFISSAYFSLFYLFNFNFLIISIKRIGVFFLLCDAFC